MEFKSQKGQDKWLIEEIFNYKKNGYFIDLASADGVHINNTYCLEKFLEWEGICIEANPYTFKDLDKKRDCIKLNCCVSDNNEAVEFSFTENPLLGGIIANDTDKPLSKSGKKYSKTSVTFETKTITQILEENNVPKVIDYVSLDIEGAEERIIKTFPYNEYKILAMTIERPTPLINEILFKNDYIFVKNSDIKTPYDTFYIHKSIDSDDIKKEPFSQIPKKIDKL